MTGADDRTPAPNAELSVATTAEPLTTVSDLKTGARCLRCGAPIDEGTTEFLTLAEIRARYKIGRTKAMQLRQEVRRSSPEAVRQASSQTSWASKNWRSLNRRMPS